jgi:alkyl hydroperoxide reductase subunit AhpC
VSIRVGDPAPTVSVEAYVRDEADPVSIDIGRRGGSWTVLFFYPRDFTFVCPTELVAFTELAHEFAAEDAAIVAASTDSYWSHRA